MAIQCRLGISEAAQLSSSSSDTVACQCLADSRPSGQPNGPLPRTKHRAWLSVKPFCTGLAWFAGHTSGGPRHRTPSQMWPGLPGVRLSCWKLYLLQAACGDLAQGTGRRRNWRTLAKPSAVHTPLGGNQEVKRPSLRGLRGQSFLPRLQLGVALEARLEHL